MHDILKLRLYLAPAAASLLLLAPGCNGNGDNPDPGNPDDTCELDADCDNAPPPICDGDEVVLFSNSGTCVDGECVYPEAGRETCEDPPAATCDGDSIVSYDLPGTCEDGACIYVEDRTLCDDPPAAFCDGDALVSFGEMGECQDLECTYPETRTVCADSYLVCDPDALACVDLCEDVSCPTRDAWCEDDVLVMEVGHCIWTTGECEYELVETESPGCAFGYNFDFEQWTDSGPDGFVMHPTEDFTVMAETLDVNSGQRSALLESTVAEDRNLRPAIALEGLTEGRRYTFHFWYRLEGQADGTSAGSLRPIIVMPDSSGSTGGGGVVTGTRITEPVEEWREGTLTTPPVSAHRASLTPYLRLRMAEDAPGIWAHTDDWAVTVPRPRNLNGRRDLDSRVFLFNEGWWIASGIDNQGVLYPSGRSAEDEDEAELDSMVFSWVGEPTSSLVPAPWDKDGRVAGPSPGGALFVLAQNVIGYCEWRRYDPEEETWVQVGNSDCSDRVGDPTGLQYSLEGTLDLVAHLDGVELASEVPPWFHFAASHWETGEGGRLVPATQAPSSRDSDGNIQANETYGAHRASFLSGRVDSPYVTP